MIGDYDIAPSEYWKMSPAEVSIILEKKRSKYIGTLHEDEYDALEERRAKLEAEGVNVL